MTPISRAFAMGALVAALAGSTAPLHGEDITPSAVLLDLGEQYSSDGRWEEALEALKVVVLRSDEDPNIAATAQHRIGQYLLAMALPAEAEAELRKVAREYPLEIRIVGASRVHLVDALAFQGRTDDAIGTARSLADDDEMLDQHRVWGHVKLVGLLREQGKVDEALTELETLEEVPWSPETLSARSQAGLSHGEILINKGMYGTAVPLLQDVVAHSSDASPVTCNWARVRLLEAMTQSHSFSDASGVVDQVIWDHGAGLASDQQLAWAFIWQGRGLKQAGQYESAIAPLQMAASTADANWPDVAFEAEFEMGEAYRLLGDAVDEGAEYHVAALGYYHAAYQRAQDASLPEGKRDQALVQVGSEMRHLGMRDRGIAWLRRGIDNPAHLSDSDHLLVSRIGEFLGSAERDAWYEYLVVPATGTDPTAGMVREEFGFEPNAALPGDVNRAFERRYWKAKLFLHQRRYAEGAASLEEALPFAESPAQRGEALTALASCNRHLSHHSELLPIAQRAATAWLEAYGSAIRPGDAHYAIDMLRASYDIIDRDDLVISSLESIVAETSPDQWPSRACFARFMLMREYESADRDADAAALGEETLQLFLGKPFEGAHDWLCAHVILELANVYTRSGDLNSAGTWLDWIEYYWPNQFRAELAVQRDYIQAVSLSEE